MPSVYEIVTERIIKKLEEGTIPWQRPWKPPMNYVTKIPYKGINTLLLDKPGEYITFRQLLQCGGRLKKGARPYLVVFWKRREEEQKENVNPDETTVDGETENTSESVEELDGKKSKGSEFPYVLRYYLVYHVSDTEGLTEGLPVQEVELKPDEQRLCTRLYNYLRIEKIPLYEQDINSAFYHKTEDAIYLPRTKYFKNSIMFLSTLSHEIVHSTGAQNRLNRSTLVESNRFGSEPYSKEELVAELGAAFLLGYHGLKFPVENAAAYISSWLSVLRKDKRLILVAASQAQRAVEYILSRSGEAHQ